MRNVMVVLPATLIAAVMVFAGLWAWNAAADSVLDFNVSRPEVAVWAVRSAAVGAIAAAQVVLLALVGARLYGRGKVDSAMAFTAGRSVRWRA
jgi:hypothetical protein